MKVFTNQLLLSNNDNVAAVPQLSPDPVQLSILME